MFRLQKGDKVGIIAPSNSFEKKDIELGLKYLENLGFEVVFSKNLFKEHRLKSEIEISRAEDVNELYKNKEIKAIFCTCGGSGSQKILDYIDYKSIKKNQKLLFGFSDNTALQLALYSQTKQVSYTGFTLRYDFKDGKISPMVEASLKKTLQREKQKITSGEKIIGGKTSGILVGGCLSLLRNLIGSKYFPNLKNSILLIEDVNEPTYKIDLMLDQLKKLPKFKQVKGIIFGQFADSIIDNQQDGNIDDIILFFSKDLNIPIIKNFEYGHIKNRYILPIGEKISLDADKCEISF